MKKKNRSVYKPQTNSEVQYLVFEYIREAMSDYVAHLEWTKGANTLSGNIFEFGELSPNLLFLGKLCPPYKTRSGKLSLAYKNESDKYCVLFKICMKKLIT